MLFWVCKYRMSHQDIVKFGMMLTFVYTFQWILMDMKLPHSSPGTINKEITQNLK